MQSADQPHRIHNKWNKKYTKWLIKYQNIHGNKWRAISNEIKKNHDVQIEPSVLRSRFNNNDNSKLNNDPLTEDVINIIRENRLQNHIVVQDIIYKSTGLLKKPSIIRQQLALFNGKKRKADDNLSCRKKRASPRPQPSISPELPSPEAPLLEAPLLESPLPQSPSPQLPGAPSPLILYDDDDIEEILNKISAEFD